MNDLDTTTDVKIDRLEKLMLGDEWVAVDMPVTHRFTAATAGSEGHADSPGIYVREIFMPAGTLLTSKIHLTEHPYVVTKGVVSVFIDGVGVQRITAPYVGITRPNTRRVLYIHEDCTWVTFHPMVDGEADESSLDAIEARIIDRRELPDGSTAHAHYLEKLMRQELASGNGMQSLESQYEYGGAP